MLVSSPEQQLCQKKPSPEATMFVVKGLYRDPHETRPHFNRGDGRVPGARNRTGGRSGSSETKELESHTPTVRLLQLNAYVNQSILSEFHGQRRVYPPLSGQYQSPRSLRVSNGLRSMRAILSEGQFRLANFIESNVAGWFFTIL